MWKKQKESLGKNENIILISWTQLRKQAEGKARLNKHIRDRQEVVYYWKFDLCSGGAAEKELKGWVETILP